MRRDGFTLTELLISIAVLAVVSIFLTQMLIQQNRAYSVVDQVSEIQNNVRAIAQLMEHEARTTGMMVPEGAALCGVDEQANSDVLFVTDSDALRYDVGATPVAGGTGYGAEILAGFDGGGSDTLNLDSVVLDGDPFYDTNGDGAADSDFQIGQAAIVADANQPQRGAACGRVTEVDAGGNSITVDFGDGSGPLGAGAGLPLLVAVPAHRYAVRTAPSGVDQLLRDGIVLADDVEDLQFAAFFDLDDDGVMDGENLEYPGATNGADYVASGWNNERLREIRFGFVVRTRLPDEQGPESRFQVVDGTNRQAVAAVDGFRRRVYSAVVRPRNIGRRY
jgi:prepilin-type N-terminal cleavage/methylation domain-containing protein